MIYLYIIINLIISFYIIKHRGSKRLIAFMIGACLTSPLINIISSILFLCGHTTFIIAYIISYIHHKEYINNDLSRFPFSKILFFIFFTFICIGVFDFRLNLFLGFYRGIYNFVVTYFLILIGYTSIQNIKDVYSFNIFFLKVCLIMTIYGCIAFYFKTNFYTQSVGNSVGIIARFSTSEELLEGYRAFRLTGFFVDAGVYGILCSCFFLYLCCMYKTFVLQNKKTIICILILLIMNLLFSATRGPMIAFICGFSLYYLLKYRRKKYKLLLYSFYTIIAISILLYILPSNIANYFTEITSSLIEIFSKTGGKETGGSNVEFRNIQFITAYNYFWENPIFGHGFEYWKENIAPTLATQLDNGLGGMESYICFLLLEYGGLHIIAITIFYIVTTIWFWNNRKIEPDISYAAISMNVMMVIFLAYSWFRGCWIFYLPLLGILCKTITLKKNTLIKNNYDSIQRRFTRIH